MTKKVSYEYETVAKFLYKSVNDMYGVPQDVLMSKTRKRDIVDLRRIIAAIIKEECSSVTVVQIGKLIGRKHSDVCIQLKNHNNLINSDKTYSSIYYGIRTEFKNNLPSSSSLESMQKRRSILEKELMYVNSQIKILEIV